jgi:hypothetical protein
MIEKDVYKTTLKTRRLGRGNHDLLVKANLDLRTFQTPQSP